MRFVRVAAFAAWFGVALLAVAGFAAFSPSSAEPAVTTLASPELARGDVAGRLVAQALGSNLFAPSAATPAGDDAEATSAQAQPFSAETPVPGMIDADPTPQNPPRAATTTTTTTPPTTTTTRPPAPATTTTTTPPTTTPPPPTTTTTLPGTTTTTIAGAWQDLVRAYFQPEDHERAFDVIWCESRNDPSATNPSSGAAGLFQHLPRFWESRSAAAGFAGADIYDIEPNVGVAAWLVYQNGGWKHWNPSRDCWETP